MSDAMSDVLATDAALDLLASRELTAADDAVLEGLACLACAVDLRPIPAPVAGPARPARQARKCGWALTVTIAMTLASSGVAAAVVNDPLAPYHFVQKHVATFVPQHGTPSEWSLDGSAAVSSAPARLRSDDRAVTPGSRTTRSLPADAAEVGSDRVPTAAAAASVPAAHRVPERGSSPANGNRQHPPAARQTPPKSPVGHEPKAPIENQRPPRTTAPPRPPHHRPVTPPISPISPISPGRHGGASRLPVAPVPPPQPLQPGVPSPPSPVAPVTVAGTSYAPTTRIMTTWVPTAPTSPRSSHSSD